MLAYTVQLHWSVVFVNTWPRATVHCPSESESEANTVRYHVILFGAVPQHRLFFSSFFFRVKSAKMEWPLVILHVTFSSLCNL